MSYNSADLFAVWENDTRIGTISINGNQIGLSRHDRDTIPSTTIYNDWTIFEAIEVLHESAFNS